MKQQRQVIKTVNGMRTFFVRKDGFEWGYFFINPNGLFVAHTDYGTYGYHWPATEGWDFLKFLANAKDMEYILGKISRRDHFDEKRTITNVLRKICEWRRLGALTMERARELWDDCPTDGPEIMPWLMEQREFYESDGHELAVYDYPSDARAFVEELFPILQAHLREERSQAEPNTWHGSMYRLSEALRRCWMERARAVVPKGRLEWLKELAGALLDMLH
ncbi:MAG TPA: hypothetical protein VGK74_22290 [Symbiobacteriaceae bacterium]|jgi:hypothetical protein